MADWLVDPAIRIAFNPRHPRRADQPVERVRYSQTHLVHERGTLQAWEEGRPRAFATTKELDAAVRDQMNTWRLAGRVVVEDEFAVVRECSARNPRLEDRIRAASDPRGDALELARWLHEQQDPRGKIGLLQERLAGVEDELERRKLRGELDAQLRRHGAHLFGPLRERDLGLETFYWQAGLLLRLRLSVRLTPREGEPDQKSLGLLTNILRLPIASCLRTLSIAGVEHVRASESWAGGSDPDPTDVGEALAAASLGGLRHLSLEDVGVGRFADLPRLETLVLVGRGDLPVPKLQLEGLRELRVLLRGRGSSRRFESGWVRPLIGARLPKLRSLTLTIRDDRVEGDAKIAGRDYLDGLLALLGATSLAGLSELTLAVFTNELPPGLVEAVAQAQILEGLERLSLRLMPLGYGARVELRRQLGARLGQVTIDC